MVHLNTQIQAQLPPLSFIFYFIIINLLLYCLQSFLIAFFIFNKGIILYLNSIKMIDEVFAVQIDYE